MPLVKARTSTSGLTGFENGGAAADLLAEQYQASLQTLLSQGYCTYGQYPWDFWEKRALARSLSKELAALGRAVMREAHQHGWEPRLAQLCGWEDEGEAMLALALAAPERANYVWEKLLDTDGCRGSYHPQTGEWISWI